MNIARRKIEVTRETDKILTLQEGLSNFLDQTKYIKKGPRFDGLLKRKGYLSYMMFTGSSGAGKTTEVTNIYDLPNSLDSARNDCWLYDKDVYYTIAPRYITRKSRDSDNKTGLRENYHIEDKEKFQAMVKNGIIGIWRERDIGSEKVLYGFSSNEAICGNVARLRRESYECVSGLDRPHKVKTPQRGGIVVYSGNNDMYRNFDKIPFCVEHKDEFVHIHVQAPDNIDRFINRSADVATADQQQLAKRASDDGVDVFENADIIIQNEPGQQEVIQEELSGLMMFIAEYNKDREKYNSQNTRDELSKTINPGLSGKTD